MLPIVVSASESAAVFDIPGPATVEIAIEAVADISAEESHSISTVTAEESSMQSESESEYISGQDAISDIIAQLSSKLQREGKTSYHSTQNLVYEKNIWST